MQHRAGTPAMEELFGEGEASASRPSPGGQPLPRAAVRGETVLVTGAAGSLGRALASRLAELPLEGLLLLDTSERGLFRLKESLEEDLKEGLEERFSESGPAREYLLADLRVEADRERALRAGPTAVIHAAAYKHVPFLEKRPIAAAQNNLLATADWLRACRAAPPVERLTLVSTDKATDPAGVMARTKAACERLVGQVRRDAKQESVHEAELSGLDEEGTLGLEATTARLCNVFGSRGSVVPRFCRRLRAGRPLPVTDPEMERRFISPEAAAKAVLWASVQEGGTYVPRAGQALRVGELARRLLKWARPEANPEEWIEVVGRRPGEAHRERLLAATERPAIPVEGGLLRAREPSGRQGSRNGKAGHHAQAEQSNGQPGGRVQLWATLDQLRKKCRAGDAAAVRQLLREAACPPASEPERPHR